ncbi:MAG: hypothetical protein JNL57_05290 [Bacteroidetes bacterium]|nr:hypothetical protein [Bacteroidota bacterium]
MYAHIAGAWNLLWEDPGEKGRCHVPVSCRNLSGDGIVTVSFWYYMYASLYNHQTAVIETDDAGVEVYRKNYEVNYNGSSNIVERIDFQKILPNPVNDNYLVLGFARDPSNGNVPVQSFIMEIDNTCQVTSVHFLGEDYQYWDMAIAPESDYIVLSGFSRPDSGLYCSTRVGVITVLDQSFGRKSIYTTTPTFTTAGIIPRFDNAKCIDVWANGGNEYIAVAGNMTIDGTIPPGATRYIPKVYVCKFQLNNSGTLTYNWIRTLDEDQGQMIPADIQVDVNEDIVFIVGSIGPGLATTDAAHWSVNTSGTAIKYGYFQGTSFYNGSTITNALRPYQITRLNSGNYQISGWTDNYNDGSAMVRRFNFFHIEYDITTRSFSNLNFYLGNTNYYIGIMGPDFTSPRCGHSYVWGTFTDSMFAYHTPAFSLTWYDGENDQSAWAWINVPNPGGDPNRHQLRIKCTISGTGDGGNCDAFSCSSSYYSADPDHGYPANPWNSNSDADPVSSSSTRRYPNIEIYECDGEYN